MIWSAIYVTVPAGNKSSTDKKKKNNSNFKSSFPKGVSHSQEISTSSSAAAAVAWSSTSASSSLTKSAAIPLYLCILAGYCLGIGIVYAGTTSLQAKELLLKQLKHLQKIRDNKDGAISCTKELRATVEMCLTCIALGLSITMAGTGDVEILRVLRELRWKVDDAIYGTHMALSMCIGK